MNSEERTELLIVKDILQNIQPLIKKFNNYLIEQEKCQSYFTSSLISNQGLSQNVKHQNPNSNFIYQTTTSPSPATTTTTTKNNNNNIISKEKNDEIEFMNSSPPTFVASLIPTNNEKSSNLPIIEDEENKNVQRILRRKRKELKKIWEKYSTMKKTQVKYRPSMMGMNLNDFIQFCQNYGLKSLITKQDLTIIHEQRVDLEKKAQFEDRLSFVAFEKSLIDISNRVYANEPFNQKYQTIESRIQKLISKIFLSNHRENNISLSSRFLNFKNSFRT
jgi:hypothetical protein